MASQITNYQCPACGGPLHYSGASGKLECDYCGCAYEPSKIEALYAEKNEKAAEAMESAGWDTSGMTEWGPETSGMRAYSCPSCGAELVTDETTAASCCPYCGNPTIVPGQFAGGLKPDYVIPFKMARKEAENALRQHYRGRPFLPGAFTAGNHISKVQGVYVPFWLFDGTAEGSARYEGRRVRTYTQGDYEITETDHYDVFRSGSLPFEKIPSDGSRKMQDDYMESVEPFHYEDLKPFSNAYLPGYLADKFDVPAEECEKRADQRCTNSLSDALARTVTGYSSYSRISETIHLQRGKVHYALLPVWILNTKWNGKDYLFMMNGQTGKMVGDLPISPTKFWGTFAGLTFSLTAILSLLFLR